MTNYTDVHRMPLYQLMIGGVPYVVADNELGSMFSTPLWPTRMWSCLGSIWLEQHEGMEPLWRWTKPNGGEDAQYPHHGRLGFENAQGPHWGGYVKEAQLGFTWRRGRGPTGAGHEDIVDVHHCRLSGADLGDGWFDTNDMEDYPGLAPSTPRPVDRTDGGYRVHAPQVVRVTFDEGTRQIGVSPDPLVVTRGGGAPIRFLRGNGHASGRMSWSFAGIELSENNPTSPEGGQTYEPKSQFVTRHVSSSEFLIIDDYVLPEGAPPEDFKYRITIRSDAGVFSLDPKVRNGTQPGSGGTPGGG